MPTTLFDALRVLAEAHSGDDMRHGFVVFPMGKHEITESEQYLCAWRIVREQLHMTVAPE